MLGIISDKIYLLKFTGKNIDFILYISEYRPSFVKYKNNIFFS